MEPRVITMPVEITLWDLRISPPDTVTEAKINPRHEEVLEWLDNVEAGAKQDEQREFELMYGRGALPIIRAVERLKRIAIESEGIADEFAKRVEVERNRQIDTVLSHLKTEPHRSLLRLQLSPTDPAALIDEIKRLLRLLLLESHREPMYRLLTESLRTCMKQRTSFTLQQLIEKARRDGIEFFPPQTFEPSELDPVVADAVYILQRCENAVPAEVLADTIGITVSELQRHLEAYVKKQVLNCENGLWTVSLRRPRLRRANGTQVVEVALRRLLKYYSANKRLPQGRRQVTNAVALAKACETDAPELVASLFSVLDKALKQTGNKRLVFEVANISISAASRFKSEASAKGKVVALICGHSWALQRVGRLEEARAAGEKSLRLGQDLGWDRNTAFCYKCLGRLYRMEAEAKRHDRDEFLRLIKLSVEWLQKAIDLFPKLTDTNLDRSGEVGDCYSLLARTYLVGGDYKNASAAAQKSLELLVDDTSKDFADLQIVLGDLVAARNDMDAAVSFYNKAIEVADVIDAERSEIAARAYFRKARVTKSVSCFEKAAEIWEGLNEDSSAASAHWQGMLLAESVPPEARQLLETVTPAVRIETVRMYEANTTAPSVTMGNFWSRSAKDLRRLDLA
jgi:tetratricopeptide (TPR) repeat protein